MGSELLVQPEESEWRMLRGETFGGIDRDPFQSFCERRREMKAFGQFQETGLSYVDLIFLTFRLSLYWRQGSVRCHFVSVIFFMGDSLFPLLYPKNFPPGREPKSHIKAHLNFYVSLADLSWMQFTQMGIISRLWACQCCMSAKEPHENCTFERVLCCLHQVYTRVQNQAG